MSLSQINTCMPHFLEFHIMPLCYYERPTLITVSTNQKKSEEYFASTKKPRSDNSIRHLLYSEPLQSSHSGPREWPAQAPSQETIQHLSIELS